MDDREKVFASLIKLPKSASVSLISRSVQRGLPLFVYKNTESGIFGKGNKKKIVSAFRAVIGTQVCTVSLDKYESGVVPPYSAFEIFSKREAGFIEEACENCIAAFLANSKKKNYNAAQLETRKISADHAIDAIDIISAQFSGNDRKIFWKETVNDIKDIGSGKIDLRKPLWQLTVPDESRHSWSKSKEYLESFNEEESWDFWINWYENRLSGVGVDPELERSLLEIPHLEGIWKGKDFGIINSKLNQISRDWENQLYVEDEDSNAIGYEGNNEEYTSYEEAIEQDSRAAQFVEEEARIQSDDLAGSSEIDQSIDSVAIYDRVKNCIDRILKYCEESRNNSLAELLELTVDVRVHLGDSIDRVEPHLLVLALNDFQTYLNLVSGIDDDIEELTPLSKKGVMLSKSLLGSLHLFVKRDEYLYMQFAMATNKTIDPDLFEDIRTLVKLAEKGGAATPDAAKVVEKDLKTGGKSAYITFTNFVRVAINLCRMSIDGIRSAGSVIKWIVDVSSTLVKMLASIDPSLKNYVIDIIEKIKDIYK